MWGYSSHYQDMRKIKNGQWNLNFGLKLRAIQATWLLTLDTRAMCCLRVLPVCTTQCWQCVCPLNTPSSSFTQVTHSDYCYHPRQIAYCDGSDQFSFRLNSATNWATWLTGETARTPVWRGRLLNYQAPGTDCFKSDKTEDLIFIKSNKNCI